MKKLLPILLACLSLIATAQSRFGYVSYMEIVKALPEYGIVTVHLDELQAKYEAELARSEREFNTKYTEFIEEQSRLPENIRVKRHKELQELMEKSMAFKDEINRTMREARAEMMGALYEKVDEAVLKVCLDSSYAYVLNTDERAYIVINPAMGVNITELLKQALEIDTLVEVEAQP